MERWCYVTFLAATAAEEERYQVCVVLHSNTEITTGCCLPAALTSLVQLCVQSVFLQKRRTAMLSIIFECHYPNVTKFILS